MNQSRRNFVRAAAALSLTIVVQRLKAQEAPAEPLPDIPERPPPLSPDQVFEFVSAAHKDLDKTRAMLVKQPSLVNGTWDWGGGDFETGLGGASHMGRRDIAILLLEHGARMDLFAAAMLGRLDIVRPAVEAFPHLLTTPGPHGISLVAHAKSGGHEALDTLHYLQSLKAAP